MTNTRINLFTYGSLTNSNVMLRRASDSVSLGRACPAPSSSLRSRESRPFAPDPELGRGECCGHVSADGLRRIDRFEGYPDSYNRRRRHRRLAGKAGQRVGLSTSTSRDDDIASAFSGLLLGHRGRASANTPHPWKLCNAAKPLRLTPSTSATAVRKPLRLSAPTWRKPLVGRRRWHRTRRVEPLRKLVEGPVAAIILHHLDLGRRQKAAIAERRPNDVGILVKIGVAVGGIAADHDPLAAGLAPDAPFECRVAAHGPRE